MSRKTNTSINPIKVLSVAIQYIVKIIVGLIIKNKYCIAYMYNSMSSSLSMPDLISSNVMWRDRFSTIILLF